MNQMHLIMRCIFLAIINLMNERDNRPPIPTLWTLDTHPIHDSDIPDTRKLLSAWRENNLDADMVALPDMLGICELPSKQPSAVISLDLCEVLRETGPSLTRMYTADTAITSHDYGVYYGDGYLGDREQLSRELLLPQLMGAQAIKAVPFAQSIQTMLQRWRQSGVYVIANTSTLPGCELSTTTFLAQNYTDSLRGILFPRNHDGKGSLTKAGILAHTKQTIYEYTGHHLYDTPTIAIEDARHHGEQYVSESEHTEVFMPAYSWNEPLENKNRITRVEQQLGTIDTFIAVNQLLRSRGIVE